MSKQVIAQCPACKARYSVTQGQLRVADGHVRCGQCLTVFDAVKKPDPTPLVTSEQLQKPVPQSTTETQAVIRLETPQSKPSLSIKPQATILPTQPKHDLLSHIRQLKVEAPRLDVSSDSSSPQGWAILGCLVAIALLATQYLWFERAHLAKDSLLLPLYTLACAHVDCTLPSSHGLTELRTAHLVVREVPNTADTLELLTGLHNTHPLPIALPKLQIHFTDINGRIVSARRLHPKDYLPSSDLQSILPNQRLDIRLLIKRPASGHLGYEVDWIAHD